MNKLSLLSSAVLFALSISVSAQAATVGQAFNVSATLTTACASNNVTPAAVDFGAYTSFGSAAIPAPTSTISFKCTRNSAGPLSVALSAAAGTIKGLAYTLAVGAVTAAPGAAGSPDVYSYVVTGAMAAGQAGDTLAAGGPIVHTLTVTY